MIRPRLSCLALLIVVGLGKSALAAETLSSTEAFRFSDLRSMNVENGRHEKLGKIDDLLYDPSSGMIDYAVIGMGGFLGVGEKLYAVPAQLLMTEDDSVNKTRRVVLDRDKKSLDRAPGFSLTDWPSFADPNWSASVDKFYGTAGRNRAEARASRLVGVKVENHRAADLGKIDDLVVDLGQRRLRYVAMAFGTTLGLGGKLFAVPFDALQSARDPNTDRFHLVLNVDEQRLKSAPGFDKNHWPDVAMSGWAADVDSFYGQPATSQTARGDEPALGRPHGPSLTFKSGDLIGMKVRNAKGEDLGALESLAIDLRTGKVRYGVVGTGGVIGIGEKMRAVPWSQLEVRHDSAKDKDFVELNVDQARFEQAPHFDRGHWPDFADASLASDADRFYGARPEPAATSPLRPLQEILGAKVRNPKGDALGKVEEVVISPRTGLARYAALSFGGFMGIGDKLFAVPWSQLYLHEDPNSQVLIADVDVQPQTLEKAPSFDKNRWPDFADPNWSRDVDQHYNQR